MPSIKSPVSDFGIILLFVLPHSRVGALEKLLDKFAIDGWRNNGRIELLTIDDQHKSNRRRIVAAFRHHMSLLNLKPKQKNIRIQFYTDLNEHARYDIEQLVFEPEFIVKVSQKKLEDDLLEIRLKEWHLHWRQAVSLQLNNWQHDRVSENDVLQWLKQFDRVSKQGKQWVGEQLLRRFRVWSEDDLAKVLSRNKTTTNASMPICVFRYENGKSADAIALMLRKKNDLFGQPRIHEFTEFLATRPPRDCLVMEDGLFTGVEYSDLLQSLCGQTGYTKCPPLPSPEPLCVSKTIVRFALGTDIGAHRLRKTIAKLRLNMEVEICQEVQILTTSGMTSLLANQLYEYDEHGKEVLCNADSHIQPLAFLESIWGQDRQEVQAFCYDLGLALWQSYQIHKGKHWSEKRLRDCALGTGNMGLLFAFAHSVPKSTLPLFWCHGEVLDQNGKPFKWQPLFHSAHLS